VNEKLAENRREYSSAQVTAQKTGANLGYQATPRGDPAPKDD